MNAYLLPVPHEPLRVAETPAEYVFHRPRLYLETSIASYFSARPTRNTHQARMQWITKRWWHSWHTQFEIFSSTVVRREAERGDREAAQRRLEFLERFPEMKHNQRSKALTDLLMKRSGLPETARNDAEHIAIACVQRMEFLLSWNCAHLANAQMASRIATICRDEGFPSPVLCTPEQLLMRYEHGHTPLPS